MLQVLFFLFKNVNRFGKSNYSTFYSSVVLSTSWLPWQSGSGSCRTPSLYVPACSSPWSSCRSCKYQICRVRRDLRFSFGCVYVFLIWLWPHLRTDLHEFSTRMLWIVDKKLVPCLVVLNFVTYIFHVCLLSQRQCVRIFQINFCLKIVFNYN